MKRSTAKMEPVCHACKEPISATAYVRSQSWAFGVAGVRWACCSAKCARAVGNKAA